MKYYELGECPEQPHRCPALAAIDASARRLPHLFDADTTFGRSRKCFRCSLPLYVVEIELRLDALERGRAAASAALDRLVRE